MTAVVEGRLLWLAESDTQIKQDGVIERLNTTPLQLQVDEIDTHISKANIQWRCLQKDTRAR